MKIYTISGLGADQRVFQYLTLPFEQVALDWIPPCKNEKLGAYAKRLSEGINTSEDFILVGVSFGGLVANEICKLLHPKLTILISTIETKYDLSAFYRFVGGTNVLQLLPSILFYTPPFIANYLFGAKNKKLLAQILRDTDLSFAKWALQELLSWGNEERLKNSLVISGSNDKLLPTSINEEAHLIKRGGHFMIVDRSDEINQILEEQLKKFKNV